MFSIAVRATYEELGIKRISHVGSCRKHGEWKTAAKAVILLKSPKCTRKLEKNFSYA